jgi:hypothetical protein
MLSNAVCSVDGLRNTRLYALNHPFEAEIVSDQGHGPRPSEG